MSTTHIAHNDQANHAAVRRLNPPSPRPCVIALFVTSFSLQDLALQSIVTLARHRQYPPEGEGERAAGSRLAVVPQALLEKQLADLLEHTPVVLPDREGGRSSRSTSCSAPFD